MPEHRSEDAAPDISEDILRPLQERVASSDLGSTWRHITAGLALAPDPALAATNLSRVCEYGLGSGAVLRSAELCGDLLFVLGASQFLAGGLVACGAEWETAFLNDRAAAQKSASDHLADSLAALSGESAEPEFLLALRTYRNREYLRIGIRDLLGLASLEETTADLSGLADAAVHRAYEYSRARLAEDYGEAVVEDGGARRPVEFVVLGMGKLGGEELNFSSDVDLIYLYECDTGPTTGGRKGRTDTCRFFTELARRLTAALSNSGPGGFVFRVDLRLRPDGNNGRLVNSLPQSLTYYESWGQTWERLALLKARPIAGAQTLGARFLYEVEPFILRRFLDFTTVEDMQELKARVERSLSDRDRRQMNVKLGRGGIREVEFVVQVLQLIHAGKDPRVTGRSTLATLDRLVEGGYLASADGAALASAYRFLRQVEHKLQVVQDLQTHTLPEAKHELRTLARRLRLPDDGTAADAADRFVDRLEAHADTVHAVFRSLFHRHVAASDTRGVDEQPDVATLFHAVHDVELTKQRLARCGFRDADHGYQYLRLLHDGPPHAPASPRRRKLLYDLAPVLFDLIRESADPDRALAHMAELVASIGAQSSFLSLLRENPPTLRTLITLFGTSQYLSRIFVRRPQLLDGLVRADLARVHKPKERMSAELMARLDGAPELEDRLDILRDYRAEEFLRIGINDCSGLLDFPSVSRQLSDLAETCLHGAFVTARAALLAKLGAAALPGRIVIVGMGKLGAAELSYNSDLDLIFLYAVRPTASPGGDHTAAETFSRLVQRLISILQVQTRAGTVYQIDTRLRPSGRAGSLVSSVPAFIRYHERHAQLWERQALIKARGVAGDMDLAAEVDPLLERFAYAAPLAPTQIAEIQRLRGRMETELAKETARRFNIKTGRGGIVDIEFLVQMLQLRYAAEVPSLRQRNTLSALHALAEAGVLSAEDGRALEQGYRFLRRLENRLRIERDQPVEALEGDAQQLTALARRMGYDGAEAGARLLDDYHEQRESIRDSHSRLFDRELRAEGDSTVRPGDTRTT